MSLLPLAPPLSVRAATTDEVTVDSVILLLLLVVLLLTPLGDAYLPLLPGDAATAVPVESPLVFLVLPPWVGGGGSELPPPTPLSGVRVGCVGFIPGAAVGRRLLLVLGLFSVMSEFTLTLLIILAP